MCVHLPPNLIVCLRAAVMETPLTEWREVQQGREKKKKLDFANCFFLWTHSLAVQGESVEFPAMSLCLQGELTNSLWGFYMSTLFTCLCLYLVSPSVTTFTFQMILLIQSWLPRGGMWACSVFHKDVLIGCGLLQGSNLWIFFHGNGPPCHLFLFSHLFGSPLSYLTSFSLGIYSMSLSALSPQMSFCTAL